MHDAIPQVADGDIVILGVTPNRPETGYGDIQAAVAPTPTLVVERFVEKPDAPRAQQYLEEGGFYWNPCMFVLKASVWLEAIDSFRPDIAATTLAAWAPSSSDAAFSRPGAAEFAAIPRDSIDYFVMESCPGSRFSISMAPLDAGRSDPGAWDALWSVLPKDEEGNAHVGEVLATDSRDTLVHATSRLAGLVSALQQHKLEEHTLHRTVHRPWRWYDAIDEGGRFKVTRIQVWPGASLSLQEHHHRAEHGVVVKGTAEITCGDKKLLLTENRCTYIPLGEVDRLANLGAIPLQIIKVQSGSYLGEDDIVRFEDHYGPTEK